MNLTERQTMIIKSIARGSNIKSIAADLNLSPKTVEGHYACARRKLGLKSVAEVVHYGIARLGVASLFAMCLLALPVCAGHVTLAWDPSPTAGATYVLYGTTNATLTETNLSQAQVIVDCGTNLVVTAYTQPAAVGNFKWTVTAKLGGVQSVPSNVLATPIPAPPAGLVTLLLQYSGTLEGIGTGPTNLFIRLKPGLP